MTTKVLTGTYAGGFALGAPITSLTVAASGYVEGTGITTLATSTFGYVIVNDGRIKSTLAGVYLHHGGDVTNGALTDLTASISGAYSGVGILGAAGTVANYGTVTSSDKTRYQFAAVELAEGGRITNGAIADESARISGVDAVAVLGANGVVANFGTLLGIGYQTVTAGAYLKAGGSVTNGASDATQGLIEGYCGIRIVADAGTVTNFGTVTGDGAGQYAAAAFLNAGGTVTNYGTLEVTGTAGMGADLVHGGSLINAAGGLVKGSNGVHILSLAGTVANNGTITGSDYGVLLNEGGTVTNGAGAASAVIDGHFTGVRVDSAAAVVTNLTTISGAREGGVFLQDGGAVTNGSATDLTASISGHVYGVEIYSLFASAVGTLINWGSITGDVSVFAAHMAVINGATADTGATIDGGISGSNGSIVNFGTVADAAGLAAGLDQGTIVNGALGDATAWLEGFVGIAAGKLSNFGIISGKQATIASVGAGAVMTNGSASDPTALVQNTAAESVGLRLAGACTNFGTIEATASGSYAARVTQGSLTNGAADDTGALLDGFNGVYMLAGTLTNFGTIEARKRGVWFQSSATTLVVEAGSLIVGSISGHGGTLDLAGRGGTISSLYGGNIDLATGGAYQEFGAVEIAKGVHFTLTSRGFLGGYNNGAGTSLMNLAGQLTVLEGLMIGENSSEPHLPTVNNGTIQGAGTLALEGGVSDFTAGSTLDVAEISESGAATGVWVTADLAFGGAWRQAGGTVTVAAAAYSFTLTDAKDTISGTLAGPGTIDITGAGDTLKNPTLSAAVTDIDAASVTLAGAIDMSGKVELASAAATVNVEVTLTGGGTLQLSNAATNEIIGAAASSRLVNDGVVIEGAGELGGGRMTLDNAAGGTIEANDTEALVIDTGAATVVNAGLIEAEGKGGLSIMGVVENTGTLVARDSDLTVDGAVTGAGTVLIAAGQASFASAFTENVTFTALGGELFLADATGYAGTITGFSKTGATSLDLEDIDFATATADYSGTTASGVLTVTDGTHTATIKLSGNYTTSTFTLANDGHGGVTVTDPAATSPSASALASAMASFATAPGGSAGTAPADSRVQLVIAAPGA